MTTTPVVTDDQSRMDYEKTIADSVYKKNIELAITNKTLSLLSKLYEISVLALESDDMANRISKVIQTDLSFDLVGILLYEETRNDLTPLAFALSEKLEKIESGLKDKFLESKSISVLDVEFVEKIIQQKKMEYTTDPADVFDTILKDELIDKIRTEGHIKSSIVYPLITGDKVIGVIIFSINRLYTELVEFEKTSIESFINVIAVAIDKALLTKQLKLTNEQQANLMHFMNHQIKGRLGNAKNVFAELLTSDYGVMPEDAKPLLQKGLEETDIGINYVTSILQGASAESGKLPYDMKPIDFKNVVEMVLEKQKGYAQTKGLEFHVHIDAGDYHIVGDALQLREAIKNLVDNSINYTPKGSVEVTLTQQGNIIRFVVKDNGVGISPEDRPKLFKSGGRGAESLKVNVNATGYGLVFVKGVIEAHKGKVWVESEGKGKGSTFFVELPK